MHKESKPRSLNSLFPPSFSISDKQKKYLDSSVEAFIYEILYRNIDESDYAILYDNKDKYKEEYSFTIKESSADKGKSLFSEEEEVEYLYRKRVRPVGRPNSPVRDLVTALVLLDFNGWTHKMLFDNLEFNLLTRRAFGIYGLDEKLFSESTFYNFQKRLSEYWFETGVNLLEKTFQKLTDEMIEQLKIKTGILRIDSFQAMSNIASYTRVRFLVELLRRFFRVLTPNEQEEYEEIFSEYIKTSSGKFVYNLSKEEYSSKLDVLGSFYNKIIPIFKAKYKDNDVFKRLLRAFEEQFKLDKNQLVPKSGAELGSNIMQSPDDEDATYRKKYGKGFRGQAVTVIETASSENKINLILDVSVDANNVDDSKILSSRVDEIKKRVTEIEEIHADGAYGSTENDEKLKDSLIVTGIRGRKPKVEFIIKESSNGDFIAKCPFQEAIANKGKKKYKVIFDRDGCKECPFENECKLRNNKKGKVFSFTKEKAITNIRNNRINTIPEEQRKLRANVEATVKEFSKNMNHKGKFKVRGKFKTFLHAIATSIGINLGRIFRLLKKKDGNNAIITPVFVFLMIFKIKTTLNNPKLLTT